MKKSIGAGTILYPNPVLIVGSYDSQGKANAMTVAWGGIASSNPPSVAISLRKATYTHGNITKRKAFTISIPSESQAKYADYFGIKSGRNEDKFAVTGLTPVKSEIVDAPYVQEFPLILECRLLHIFELGLHTQFVGEIMDVKVDEDMLDEGGKPDIKKIRPFFYDHSGFSYYGIGELLGKAYTIGKDISQ
ncbi:MAG: flavoredoxin [Spirochaetae bacterium HGW-Spirochaetae-1]|jgi:flavin reductase (DIM6/NTAB) family NADH-FMN oxidoreductase RutF|nr:MAG: flavoredoxin [Spirochaetae bacterium HGW-Spirochaetae-1]